MNKEKIEILNKCDNCKLRECIGCEITYSDIQNIKEYIDQLETKVKELENVLNERFIYVTGARTVYGRLMELDKEIIVRDDLKLRNELNQIIKEKQTVIENIKHWIEDEQNKFEAINESYVCQTDEDEYYKDKELSVIKGKKQMLTMFLNILEGEKNERDQV